ncbi:LysR family transcriptional regulator [Mesorhizobium sp. RMAD-H1]|uniref:LysR family transcriptional regulator n=1 Tax=Mesorhizobium sp. RMAD-H1 TaxID=2587065 RepID=UPI00161B55C3|nr:LysR family transcriptional regulator [Mesorhizobium sp. RMAD-H1]MBB2969524.1 DNA-binding transcriptional LysR family regulator [Mesorhizobium sp. RMAD-H1]
MTSLIQVLAVAEYLNFRHAANALGVSQSSVSARVKTLEENLGVLLFERHARGVRLTQAGRHIIEGIAAALDQLDHTIRTAGMLARGERGHLRVGVHALIPGGFLSTLLRLYREQYPGIEVEIIEDTARDGLTQLRTGRLDIAFVVGVPELSDCHSRRIWTEPLVAALPDRHPLASQTTVAWTDLARETFLVRHGGTGPQVYDHIVLRLAGRCYAPSILRFEVERSTILSMVGQGFGITITGAATSLATTSGVVFLPVVDEPEPITFSAVWSPFNRGAALRNLLTIASKMDWPYGSSRPDS